MTELPFVGRVRPYGPRAIRKAKCTRCGRRAEFQWQACANGRRHTPVCPACDYGLNAVALRFMRIENAAGLLARYRRTLEAIYGPLDIEP